LPPYASIFILLIKKYLSIKMVREIIDITTRSPIMP
jgi:hypothetical protein